MRLKYSDGNVKWTAAGGETAKAVLKNHPQKPDSERL